MTATNKLEESYIRHILIAIQAGDCSAPYRTFFDSWFAFRTGGPFLNSNSRPQWLNNPCPDKYGEALRRAHFVSVAAARTLAGIERERLLKDHAIPVSILRDMLFDARPKSAEDVRSFMERYYRIGIITKAEDNELCAANLRSLMPKGWEVTDSPFVRYSGCNIVPQDMGRSARCVRSTPTKDARSSWASGALRLLGNAHSGLHWKGKLDG